MDNKFNKYENVLSVSTLIAPFNPEDVSLFGTLKMVVVKSKMFHWCLVTVKDRVWIILTGGIVKSNKIHM